MRVTNTTTIMATKIPPEWVYKPPPARIFTAVGDLCDDYLKRRDILILCTFPATGVQLDYVECNMLQQFPHYRLDVGYDARLNHRSVCHNWSPTEYRLGKSYTTAPEAASSNPVIITLVNRYSNMKPSSVLGSGDYNNDDDLPGTCIKEHHSKQLLDTSYERLYHFQMALYRFVRNFICETYKRPYLDDVKTVVIPYLLGNCNVEEWMLQYFPELIDAATGTSAEIMGVDFVFLIPRVINSIDFFTPNIRKYTELKETFGKFPIYDFYPQTIVPRIMVRNVFAINNDAATATLPLETVFIKQEWEEEEEKEYKMEINEESRSPIATTTTTTPPVETYQQDDAMDEEPVIKQEKEQ